jgi:hypothetical protein
MVSRIVAVTMAGVILVGCAATFKVPDRPKTIDEVCDEQSHNETQGWRTATYSTLAVGAFFWPALVVPLGLGITSMVKEHNAKQECLTAKYGEQQGPASPTTPTALDTTVTKATPPTAPSPPAPTVVPVSTPKYYEGI